MTPLAQLREGTDAVLRHVSGQRAFRRRLMEMGFLPGTPVRLLRRNDVADVVELEVRNCRVALRAVEAAAVLVSGG